MGVQGQIVGQPGENVLAVSEVLQHGQPGEVCGCVRRHPQLPAGQDASSQRSVQPASQSVDGVAFRHASIVGDDGQDSEPPEAGSPVGMAEYTKPKLRDRIKEKIKAADKGGKKGQWSARKSQLLAREYEKQGGGYQGSKDKRQKSLKKWGEENWQTKEGGARARGKNGETKRYLPKKVWDQLSDEEKEATDTKKRKASKSGKQHVSNTGAAKNARTAGRLDELPVSKALKLVGDLDKHQLSAALKRERGGKGRKTLIAKLESELSRR